MSDPARVVLLEYDPELFPPLGNESPLLASVGAVWESHQITTPDRAVEIAREADIVVIQSVRPLLNAEVIAQLERCRCIVRMGAGYDSVDCDAATAKGITVCNVPAYCTAEVADHALALLLACLRVIPRGEQAVRGKPYRRLALGAKRRLEGATIGIIGLGRIGSTVARRLAGWEPRLLAYDPYITSQRAQQFGAELVDWATLLTESDVVTVHCPLTSETHHMLDAAALGRLRPGAILINTARGPIVDETALVHALTSGQLWAAGLDVTEQEPLSADSPLLALDNVILTPHVAAYSPQAREDLYRMTCEIAIQVLSGETPESAVNLDALAARG
ncbi:MAG: C-terminal binding protein [Anaerolineae bacterium]|jgi:D-3-phosphoglycerate dehydrogenase